jgi:predicted O-methyltransferase YrrM
MSSFEGVQYHLANCWYNHVPLAEYSTKPIHYLEIGTLYGANLLSVAKSYGMHPDSKLHCIDPWEDYEHYPEYKGEQPKIYDTFMKNLDLLGDEKSKVNVHRGYSNRVVPTLDDDSFDIIYIDGNHEPEYVLEDAVLCFRKLKCGGVLIFDDYGWGGPDLTKRGIDAFISGYHKRVHTLGLTKTSQMIVRKIR